MLVLTVLVHMLKYAQMGPALPLGASLRPYCAHLWYHACRELVPNA